MWLRLAKISQAGAALNTAARGRLGALSAKHPNWRLAANERDEFPTWSGDPGELRVHVTTPRDRDELIEWLRENPEPGDWRPDDWNERCRSDFGGAASALVALAADGIWPTGRWREALQRWSEDELQEHSWHEIAPVLVDMPGETLQELCHGVDGGWRSWQELSKDKRRHSFRYVTAYWDSITKRTRTRTTSWVGLSTIQWGA